MIASNLKLGQFYGIWICDLVLTPDTYMLHFVAMPQAHVMAPQVLLFAVCHHKMYLAPGYYIQGLTIPDTAEVLV